MSNLTAMKKNMTALVGYEFISADAPKGVSAEKWYAVSWAWKQVFGERLRLEFVVEPTMEAYAKELKGALAAMAGLEGSKDPVAPLMALALQCKVDHLMWVIQRIK